MPGASGLFYLGLMKPESNHQMNTREQDSRTADQLWAQYARTHDPVTRDQIIHQFERLAYSIANRYHKGSGPDDDVTQVALMGLVKAVDRFDPSTKHRFSTFATPTILGEIKRYFRDSTWNIHVPRGLQELSQATGRAERYLTAALGREPTLREIASHLDVDEQEVTRAAGVDDANRPLSLDGEVESRDGEHANVLEHCLGREDPGLGAADDRIATRQMVGHLSGDLRQVITLRYFGQLSQREVARRMGLSQVQVSRLEKRALTELRGQMLPV